MLVELCKALTPIVACVCIAIVELKALELNIDGGVIFAALAGLAGLGGFHLGAWLMKREKP